MAATPVKYTCTADTWVLVASNVTTGVIHKVSVSPNVYKITTRVTGDPAPTDDALALLAFSGCELEEIISDSAPIDVYIKAVRVDGEVVTVL